MSKLDSKGPHVGVVTVSVDRGLTAMQELDAMAATPQVKGMPAHDANG